MHVCVHSFVYACVCVLVHICACVRVPGLSLRVGLICRGGSVECCEIYNYCGVQCYDSAGASGDSTSQRQAWETLAVCVSVCANTETALDPKHDQPPPPRTHGAPRKSARRLLKS